MNCFNVVLLTLWDRCTTHNSTQAPSFINGQIRTFDEDDVFQVPIITGVPEGAPANYHILHIATNDDQINDVWQIKY